MSWLADIAGKAEDFLNKIDQNAAVALSNVNENSKHSPRRSKHQVFAVNSLPPDSTGVSSSVGKTEKSRESGSASGSSVEDTTVSMSKFPGHQPSSSQLLTDFSTLKKEVSNRRKSPRLNIVTVKPKSVVTDDELLEFLNSEDKDMSMSEVAFLKKELMSQASDMKVLVKNYNQLQKEHEALVKLHEKTKDSKYLSELRLGNQPIEVGRIRDLELTLTQKDEEIRHISERLDQALIKLQNENQAHLIQNRLEQVELEKKRLKELNEESARKYSEITGQLQVATKQAQSIRDSLEAAQEEYATYKNKAKSILKSKDELIASLENQRRKSRDAGTDEVDESSLTEEDNRLLAEINTLRNERELFQAEISQSISQIECLKEENNRIENELLSFRSINSDLQNIVTKERQRVRFAQEENLQLSQTISSLQLDLDREILEKKKIQEKHRRTPSNNSITRSSSSSDFQFQSTEQTDQLRTRITALSQSLLEKQSLINELSSDKQLLQIKIERLESHLQELRVSVSYENDGNYTQSVVSNQPLYLSESPWDTSVALRMKRVYSQVDSLCCQFGLAMRQRPTVRLIFSAYVILLHIWVFFVLFSWSHNYTTSDSHKK